MKRNGPYRYPIARLIVLAALFTAFFIAESYASDYAFTVSGRKTYLNSREFLVKGLRCSNALVSDTSADQLIRNLDVLTSYGVNTISVYFMGSRFGDVKGYNVDATLNPIYAERMGRIIEAADERGMVVLVGCLYWGGSRSKWEGWTQVRAEAAVANTVRWLKDNDYRNVFVDIDNEGMAKRASGFDSRGMVIAGKKVDSDCIIATNFRGEPPPESDLGIHFSKKAPDKPYIESEATPGNAPGGYWGKYSKQTGYYNYINIGVYNEAMKRDQIAATARHLDNGHGYMCASTWLQCVPPYGPNHKPGGDGSKSDPGIRWWLEFLRDKYGPYTPPPHQRRSGSDLPQTGIWQRFEASLKNDKKYADPFRDVSLDVVYTAPNGRKLAFWGFYDGADTWKIRFMPSVTGRWRYEARFSDGRPGIEGQFECVKSDVRGMISAYGDNPIWFGFKDDGPVLLRSFHVGDRFFAENFEPSKRKAFLDWAQQQGYNMLSIASHYLNRTTEGRGKGWKSPNLWDSDAKKPVPSEYRKAEAILDDLAARKIIVFPFAGFFGRDSDYPQRPSDQSLYIKYTLARIAPYWNVMFNLAGPEPRLGSKAFLNDQIDRLGEQIAEFDPFGHLLSVHNRTGDDEFGDKTYTSFITLQGPKTLNREKLRRGLLRNLECGKPLYAQETLWAGNKNHPRYSLEDLRKNAYTLMFSGATLNFAENSGNSSSGFSGDMDLGRKNQKVHDAVKSVWDFFEPLPFCDLSPRPDLVDKGSCLAKAGERYLVYLPSGDPVNVSVRNGPYKVIWIDARNPSRRHESEPTTDGANLSAPADGDDWVLHLVRHDLY